MVDRVQRVAIVTGGASGIGEAVVRRLARESTAVVIADRSSDAGERLAAELSEAGFETIFVQTDVSSESDVERLVETALAKYERLDAAVNAAGVAQGGGIFCDPEIRDRTIGVNISGVFYCVAAQVKAMRKSAARGSIVNVSSVFGVQGNYESPYYAASKHAVIGFSKSVALEVASEGIRVNVVCPGLTRSAMTDGFFGDELARAASKYVPIGRIGEPEDQAAAIIWLCSNEASLVTGAAFHIDGGQTAGLAPPPSE